MRWFALVAISGALAGPVHAQTLPTSPVATLIVSKAPGAAYATIQSALDAAPDNAVIHVSPGTYEEILILQRPVTLEGEGWDKTTIAPHLATVHDMADMVAELKKLPEAQQNDIGLARVKQLFHPGISVDCPGAVHFRELRITADPGTHTANTPGYSHALLRLDHTQATIDHCALTGSPGNVVSIDGGTAEFRQTLIAAAWWTGINIGVRDGQPTTVSLTDCDIRNNYYAGVCIAPAERVTINRCRISGSAWHGIRYDDASPTITNCRISNNARCGIYASGSTSASIKNNLFLGNEMDGIGCWFANTDTIANNTFAHNLRESIMVLGNARPFIDHNIFFASPIAIDCSSINGSPPDVGNPQIGTNLYWKIEIPRRIKLATSPDAGKIIQGDPHFINPDADDFSLPATLPENQKQCGTATPLPPPPPSPFSRRKNPSSPPAPAATTSSGKLPPDPASFPSHFPIQLHQPRTRQQHPLHPLKIAQPFRHVCAQQILLRRE